MWLNPTRNFLWKVSHQSLSGKRLRSTRVVNNGNAPINSVVLTNRFSDSLEAVRATEDFQFTRISDTEYAFAIGTIEPGEEKLLEVEYLGLKPDGNATSEFALTSTSNITVSYTHLTLPTIYSV